MTTRPRAGGPLLAAVLLATAAAALACPACETRQQLRRISLNLIKQQILAKLGLETAPNITARQLPRIPPLDHLYEKMQADQPIVEDHDDNEVTFEKVLAFAQPHPKVRHWRGKELLHFQFSEKVMENKVVKALLWVYLRPTGGHEPEHAVLSLHRVTAADPPLFIPFSSKKEPRPRGSRGRWTSLDVKRLVSEWFKLPGENAGLAVEASIPGQDQMYTKNLISISTDTETSNFVPFLEVHIADSRKPRSKRTISLNCPENSEETRCCRYPLTVDFEEFGWDWIIAPKKYEANYCSGECPYVFLTKYPHTHIVHLANPSGTSGPCCAPRKMSSISMLYFDQSFNIIYGLLPGMVVDRCGCS